MINSNLEIIGANELEKFFVRNDEMEEFINNLANEFGGMAESIRIMRLNYELLMAQISDGIDIESRLYKRDGSHITILNTNIDEDAQRIYSTVSESLQTAPEVFNNNFGKIVNNIKDFSIDKFKLKIIQDCMYGGLNVLLKGGPGTGKTDLPQKLARELDMQCLVVDCGTIKTPQDWFGTREFIEGEGTKFVESELLYYLQRPSIIILDELNRTTPDCHNSIFRILDGNRKVHILPLKKTITVHPHCMILATINEGRSHTGTFMLDSAITDRFEIFKLDIPSQKEIISLLNNRFGEKIPHQFLSSIADITHKLSSMYEEEILSVNIGMRPAITSCILLNSGYSLKDVTFQAFANKFSDEGGTQSEQQLVKQTISGIVDREILQSNIYTIK